MTDGPLRIAPGELSVEEILDHLQAGTRVVIERDLLGSVHEVTLRFDGEVYYCDTPTTLHRHRTADEMRECLANERYGSE
jgi:hypothetical protein